MDTRMVYTLPHLEGVQYRLFRSVADALVWAEEWMDDLAIVDMQYWIDD